MSGRMEEGNWDNGLKWSVCGCTDGMHAGRAGGMHTVGGWWCEDEQEGMTGSRKAIGQLSAANQAQEQEGGRGKERQGEIRGRMRVGGGRDDEGSSWTHGEMKEEEEEREEREREREWPLSVSRPDDPQTNEG